MNEIINSHIHLFDANGINKYYEGEKCIGFADYLDDTTDYLSLYDNYIKNHEINGGLLAVGKDAAEMIKIKNNHLGIIKGYGEIKLYKGNKYNFDRENFRDLLDYNEDNENLPIMFHYDVLDAEHIFEIESWLRQYPNTKFIHCHCGCSGESYVGDVWAMAKTSGLAKHYDNYYVDLSWTAADLIKRYNYKIPIIYEKILTGTDTNVDMTNVLPNPNEYALQRKKLFIEQNQNSLINEYNRRNVKTLFNI